MENLVGEKQGFFPSFVFTKKAYTMSEVQKPQPPKGDHPESWKADITAFNFSFTEVLFEGYSKEQAENWIKREIIDTAQITKFERIGLLAKDPEAASREKVDILRDLISEKLDLYNNQIAELESLITQSEAQAALFEDHVIYNEARKRDIERFKVLKSELEDLLHNNNIVIESLAEA